jgi:hypothetical protein
MTTAESMCAAYLKYVEKCPIVCTNVFLGKLDMELDCGEVQEWCDKIAKKFAGKYPVFNGMICHGRVDTIGVIKQAELDVVGLNFANEWAYVYEVADHRNGLSYGDTIKDTITKVIEKIVRGLIVARTYLDASHITVCFVATVVNKSMKKRIEEVIGMINDCLPQYDDGDHVQVSYCLGREIASGLINRLIEAYDCSYNDDFMRFLGLMKECYELTNISDVKRMRELQPRSKKARQPHESA